MKEHPKLLCTEMVKAILDDRKSVTREVINIRNPGFYRDATLLSDGTYQFNGYGTADFVYYKPRYHKGDLLWVRETYCHGIEWDDCKPSKVDPLCGGNDIWYFADGERPTEGWGKTRTPVFMPKWVARIWLEVLDVRAERLQDITEADAIAEGLNTEGCCLCPPEKAKGVRFCLNCNERLWDFVEEFQELWDSIYAKRGFGWDINPWVRRIEFKKIKP